VISFMVIGAPRSGTAWAANWLTTERTLCLHEALFEHYIEDLDALPHGRLLGLADTGLSLFPQWLMNHPAKKVILHRPRREIERSLRRAGLPYSGTVNWVQKLHAIEGLHVEWDALFKAPRTIHEYLFGDSIPFDQERHALLSRFNVQADFEKIDPDPAVCRRLVAKLQEAAQA
jgi:hypothetical protein